MSGREFDPERIGEYIKSEWKQVEPDTIWSCIRCGRCCMQPWSINLTWIEYDRLKNDKRIKKMPDFRKEVDPESGLDHPYYVIHGACPMLKKNGMICSIHPEWPYTCATYPFLMMPDGDLLYHTGCKGLGSGDLVDIDSMKKKISIERKKAGMITGK